MSQVTEIDYETELSVLHAEQAPRFTIVKDKNQKFCGTLTWRGHWIKLDMPCQSEEEARSALAKQALHTVAADATKTSPLAVTVASTTPTLPLATPVVFTKQDFARQEPPLSVELVVVARQNSDEAFAMASDGSAVLLRGVFAKQLQGRVGAKIRVQTALRTGSLDHLPKNLPFTITCVPLFARQRKRLFAQPIAGIVTSVQRIEADSAKVRFTGPAFKRHVLTKDILFFITSDLVVPSASDQPVPVAALSSPNSSAFTTPTLTRANSNSMLDSDDSLPWY